MRNKTKLAILTAVAFLGFSAAANANVINLKTNDKTVCEDASWIVYNLSETDETNIEFDAGPQQLAWEKLFKMAIAPGGYLTNAITMKTTFTNKGPGEIQVNCQRQRFDRHDWKIDAGSGKTYQNNYHLDHTRPSTYIEPGMGQPTGTERSIFDSQGQKPEFMR